MSAGKQDPRLEVLPCMHSGTYADDCICERIRQHKCYIVATCDRDLRRRIRKVSALLQVWRKAADPAVIAASSVVNATRSCLRVVHS